MLKTIVIRILKSILQILIWIDQGLGLILSIPFYLVFGHPNPDARTTISWVVGYYAHREKKWAIAIEWVLDRIFYPFEGFRLGHCRKYHIEPDEVDWENANLP